MSLDNQAAGGTAAAVAFSTFASLLVPKPPDMAAIFMVTAVGSGSVGYWISKATDFKTMGCWRRFIVGVVVILILVLLSYGYVVYYHLPTPTFLQDIGGFAAFGVMFATICFVLGLLQIEVFRSRPGSEESGAELEN